jgi:hypothetical protein
MQNRVYEGPSLVAVSDLIIVFEPTAVKVGQFVKCLHLGILHLSHGYIDAFLRVFCILLLGIQSSIPCRRYVYSSTDGQVCWTTNT